MFNLLSHKKIKSTKIKFFLFFFILNFPVFIIAQEDLGKKYYESAITFMKAKNYPQAIDDLLSIIKNLPESPYADEALLELGKYYLEIEKNEKKAKEYFTMLKEKYVKTENGPAGYYYLGDINLVFGSTPEQLRDAYANFERVPLLFPHSKWVQPSLYKAGITLRLFGQPLNSIAILNQSIEKFPNTEFTELSKLELALSFLSLNKSTTALRILQEVLDNSPSPSIKNKAMDYLSYAYRYHFWKNSTSTPLYQSSKENFFPNIKLNDPKQIFLNLANKKICILDEGNNSIYETDLDGNILQIFKIDNLRSFFFNRKGELFLATKKFISTPEKETIQFSYIYELKTKFIKDIKDAAIDAEGNYYIIDGNIKGLFKFNNKAEEIDFPLHKTKESFKKILIDQRNRILLVADDKLFKIYNTDGELLYSIADYNGEKFKEIKDFTIDAFENIYILDSDSKTIYIYDNLLKPLAKFNIPENIAPVSIASGFEGELYLINKKTKSIFLFK